MIDSTPERHASPSGDLQAEIVRALADTICALGYNADNLDLALRRIPLEGEWGFGSAVAFQLRKNGAEGTPQEIALRVAAAIPTLPQLERVEAVNSYINFYVDKNWYANRVVAQVLSQGGEYGCWPRKEERVMVEYANVNTHKTMHVGHLRNVCLGATIVNILHCYGYETVSATYIGDIGLHVIRTLWAYLNFHKGQEPLTGQGTWLEKLYVEATSRLEYRNDVVELIADAAKADPAIAAQLATALQAMAETDPQDAPYARQIHETLLTREGPDWKPVLASRDHIVLNLWDELGRLLLAQPSTLDTTNSDLPQLQSIEDEPSPAEDQYSKSKIGVPSGPPKLEDPLAPIRRDYERLDAHRDWWDQVPGWQAEIKELFARWESQDPEIVKLWEVTRRWSLDMLKRIFHDLGVNFDAWFFESEVEEPGKQVVDELIKLGIAEDHRAEGETVIVRVDDQLRANPELSKKYQKELYKTNKDGTLEPRDAWRVLVVLRSDGTSLYATKDLELARRKFTEWHIDRSIYVIDTRQSLYFQQIYRTLELWGFPQAEKAMHLGYEIVTTPEGAISSRKGGVPLYEEFEAEALRRARAIVDQKEAEQPRGLREEQKDAIARAVAYGALKMGMLDKDNNKVITFVWEQALNPESQSATYVQYSHARATRVLEKAPPELLPQPGTQADFSAQTLPETSLLEMIAAFPEEVSRAAEAYKPVTIATYCFDLADAFNNFYHNCPILKAPNEELVKARLALTSAARQTLANALGLLGIQAPGIM
ncbi:MAG: arginine--tRNA ligase [Chloroflexia bacterium]